MWRIIGSLCFVAIVGGCVNVDSGPETGGARPHWGKSFGPPTVPGVEGPYGTKVGMAAPYNMAPPGSEWAARTMMRNPVPMDVMNGHPGGNPLMGPMGMPAPPGGPMGMPMGMPKGGPMGMPPGGPMGGNPFAPGGNPMAPTGPSLGIGAGSPFGPGMPPMMPGMSPGGNIRQASFLSPPNQGVMPANVPPGGMPGNVTPAQFANSSPVGSLFPAQRTQVSFGRPDGMKVYWYSQGKDGKPNYSVYPLETPGKYNFAQGAIYRLKLTHIPGRPLVTLYPTLEVVPTSPRTNEFLAHNSVPLDFTEDDFKQVVDRNYIVKVIYLPDPQNQDVAGSGPDEISSTRLEPGQDPIQEALRRGSILLVLRIGNIDQEEPNSPSMTAPAPGMGGFAPGMGMPGLGMPPGPGVQPLFQVPYFGAPNNGAMNPGPFPVPPGVGADAEKAKPKQLPPLPGEQLNKNNPELPFGPPPAKDPKSDPPAPNKNEDKDPKLNLPPLPNPNEGIKLTPTPFPPVAAPPGGLELPPPMVVPKPPEFNPPKAPTSGIPVSNPKIEPTAPAFVLPPMPTINKNGDPSPGGTGETSKLPAIPTPPLPMAPTKTDNLPPIPPGPPVPQITMPPLPTPNGNSGTGAPPGTNTPTPSSGLPGSPALPPIPPDLLNNPDLPAIPLIPPMSEKK